MNRRDFHLGMTAGAAARQAAKLSGSAFRTASEAAVRVPTPTTRGVPEGLQIMDPYLEGGTAIEFAAALAGTIGGFKPLKDFA